MAEGYSRAESQSSKHIGRARIMNTHQTNPFLSVSSTPMSRRLFQPSSVALSLNPQKHFHGLCLGFREQAVLWQRLATNAA